MTEIGYIQQVDWGESTQDQEHRLKRGKRRVWAGFGQRNRAVRVTERGVPCFGQVYPFLAIAAKNTQVMHEG